MGFKALALRKVVSAILTIAVIVCANFFIFRMAPGDPVQGMIGQMAITGGNIPNSDQLIEAWRQRFGHL